MTDVNPAPASEEQKPAEAVAEAAPVKQPGEKTDPALLLKSLQEERKKRQDLESQIALLQTTQEPSLEGPISDEGRLLHKEIQGLKQQLVARERTEAIAQLRSSFPALADKSAEFDQYLADNPGMKLEVAAKAFLVERDLLAPPAPRKGLEPEVGGGRTVPASGMTPEEVDNLRVNNYAEYSRRLRNGTLKI